jgi:hypothetical protein
MIGHRKFGSWAMKSGDMYEGIPLAARMARTHSASPSEYLFQVSNFHLYLGIWRYI